MTLTLHVDCASSININLPPAVKHRSLYMPLVNTWLIVTFSSPSSVIPASSGWSAWYNCNRYFLILNRLQKILSFTLPLTFPCIMLFPFCFVMSCPYYIKKLHFIQGLPSILYYKKVMLIYCIFEGNILSFPPVLPVFPVAAF